MHALAGEGVEIHRQRGDQGFTLTGLHFGNAPVMQHHAANQLHVKMAHAEHALGGLTGDGKGFFQQGVELFAIR